MSIENMTTTIDRLLDKEVGNGASIEAVQAVKSLGVRFPNDYEAFLYKYGWARALYDEFYGVGGSVPEHLDLVVNAERERTAFRPYLPNYLIPVMPDGAGNHYCIDTSRIADGTCPVVFWDHDFDESQTPGQCILLGGLHLLQQGALSPSVGDGPKFDRKLSDRKIRGSHPNC